MRLPTRLTASLAATALVAGAGLVAAAPATAQTQPAGEVAAVSPAADFSSLTISGLKKKQKLPKAGKIRKVKFTVNIAGAPADANIEYKNYDADFAGPRVVPIKSKVKNPNKPRIVYPSTLAPGANTFTLEIPSYASPGSYELQIPVTQNDWSTNPRTVTTKVVKAKVNINATAKISRAATSYFAPSWKTGATAKITFQAPAYQKGAKVTLQYKAPKSKWKKVTTKKLKVKKGAYNATAVLKTKKLRPGHKIRFKVSKVKWAPAYKTKTDKIVRR